MSKAMLMNNYGPAAATFVRGSGAELWDDQGRHHLDFLSGLAVTSLGHAHPKVTHAVSEQVKTLTHTSNLFANEHTASVVSTLDTLIRAGDPEAEPPGRILFQNSGAETIEAVLKLARKHHGRGRHGVVSAYGSFHGRTLAALAATGQPEKHEPFQPLPEGFRHVAFDDIDALVAALDPSVGAVLLETVQGEGGVVPASNAYLQAVREVCDERGILLIIDEIQTGLGRTGRWFGYQHAGIQPDIVTMAKALGNGVPVGAVWARPHVAEAFGPGDHGSTFAGQALVLAAVQAVLTEMVAMDAPAVARQLGESLRNKLAEVDGVKSVRGRGLLLAAEISTEALAGRSAKDIATGCLQRGLVVNGVTLTAVRMAPPFVVTLDQIASAVKIFADVIGDGTATATPSLQEHSSEEVA